jgi:NhaP-type Na+/H+ or K+/H+ antiporter
LAVAVILFEGGLSLKIRELRAIGGDLIRLTTLGALVTWLVSAAAAHFLLAFEWPLAAMMGAILVVTGPTVIGPLLRHLRLGGRTGAVLKWEGIVIDPLGATLAVLTFAVVKAGGWHGGAADAASGRSVDKPGAGGG